MPVIKTGLLCVPAYDETAVTAVRRLLARAAAGCIVVLEQSAPMQRRVVEELLRRWADEEELDLVLTLGGTLPAAGPSGREIVPDATLSVAERLLPGLAETMRTLAREQAPLALLDRSVAAIRGRTLLLNLPAGAAAALFLENVLAAIPAAVALLQPEPPPLHLVAAEATLSTPAAPPDAAPAAGKKPLDAAEFAAFLARKKPPE